MKILPALFAVVFSLVGCTSYYTTPVPTATTTTYSTSVPVHSARTVSTTSTSY